MISYDWEEQLEEGKRGERLFLNKFSKGLVSIPFEHKAGDFSIRKNKKTIELKTDKYDMKITPNFFIEKYSTDHPSKPLGGPFRAVQEKVDYFIYFFIENDVLFCFDPKDIVEFLEDNPKYSDEKLVPVKNKGYTTLGFKIPRNLLLGLTIPDLSSIIDRKLIKGK